MGHGLAKKSLILFFSEGTSSVLTMATGLAIARLFHVADFGKYTSALAFASIVAVLVDSGMGMMAAKDIACGTARDHSQLNQLFSWRIWMILTACVVAPVAARFMLPVGEVRHIAFWLTPGVLLFGTADFFCWIFKGAQRAVWCAGLQISSRLLLLVFSVMAVLGPHPMRYLVMAYGITGLSMTGLGIYVVRQSLQSLHWVRLPGSFFRQTLPDIYRLGAIVILGVAFTRVDLMLVVRMSGDASAGLFSAAGRVIDALRLIPMVVYSVYLPLFSSIHDKPALLRSHFKVAYDLLLMLAITIALVGSTFAGPLFHYVLGPQYAGAVVCFRPLIWSCVLMFSNILMFSLLYARNDHRTPLLSIIGAIIIEVILDLVLLPHLGIVGAAWGRLAAEFFACSVLAIGILRSQLLSAGTLFIRPALLITAGVALLVILKSQPLVFQLFLPWSACAMLAWVLGLGRLPRNDEAVAR